MELFGRRDPGKGHGPELIDEVSPERRDEILDYLAKKISDYGMITPAILVLESHKPFSYILSQGVHFFAPFGDVLLGSPYVSEIGYIMQDRENVSRLVDRLEALAKEEDKKRNRGKKSPQQAEEPEAAEEPEEHKE